MLDWLWSRIQRLLLGGFLTGALAWLGWQALEAIWQGIVQDGWKAHVQPWLESPLTIETTWGTAMAVPLIVTAVLSGLFVTSVIFYRGRRYLSGRVQELEDALNARQSQVLDTYAWEFLSVVEQWGRSLAIMQSECSVAPDPERYRILQRLVAQVVWDCASLIQGDIIVSGSVSLRDPSRPGYLALVHLVGVAEERREVRHFYVGNDSTLLDQCGIAGHTFKAGETVIVSDIHSDSRYAWHAGDVRPKSSVPYVAIAAAPLVCDDGVVGVFCLDGRVVNCFDEERVKPIIEYAAKYLAEALQACGPRPISP